MELQGVNIPWTQTLFITTVTLILFGQAQAIGNKTQPVNRVVLNTLNDLMYYRDYCKRQKENLQQEFGSSDEWEQYYSDECRYIDIFTIGNLTVNEIFHWIEWSNGDSKAVNMLTDEQTGLSGEALKILIHNMTSVDYGFGREKSAALALIGEAYFKREGLLDNLKVADVEEFGAHFVYLLPPQYYESMSKEVFDHVLELYDTETNKARIYFDQRNAAEAQNQIFSDPINFIMGATYNHMIWVDEERIRALCRTAFSTYSDFETLTDADLNRIRSLMQCAPPSECSHLPNNWVKRNVETYDPKLSKKDAF